MPNDVILLNALAKETNKILKGGRVEKIYQPEVDEITIAVKNNGKLHTLVISASPTTPRAHITTAKKENALSAPSFCMLLRKYLGGSNIADISIFNCDRIIRFTFDSRTELKDRVRYFLIAELMGRYSNIILTDEKFTIIDAIRRIHFDQSTTRYILPNLQYTFQPKNKISLDDDAALDEAFKTGFASFEDLPKVISGIGKETAKEIFFSEDPRNELKKLYNIFDEESYSPALKFLSGKPKDYFVRPYKTSEGTYEKHATLNECLDIYYALYDGEERKKASSKTVTTLLKRLQNKNERRIKDNLDKINDRPNMEKVKKYGELILNNIYLIKGGDSCAVTDYETGEQVVVPLDPSLSPSANAAAYFKRYNKLKRGVEIAEKQLAELYVQRDYLKSIETAIANCSTKIEYDEILAEINEISGYKRKNDSRKRERASRPKSVDIGSCKIIFGKNNIQNNEVTFKIASRADLWLHVKNRSGSHVIIRGEYDDKILTRAAEIAAYYSECKDDEKVDVDYTLVKFVKKIPSALPGQVTYVNYKTITVAPRDENED